MGKNKGVCVGLSRVSGAKLRGDLQNDTSPVPTMQTLAAKLATYDVREARRKIAKEYREKQ